MVVESFDPSAGVYAFQFQDMDTALHSHPAIEILFAEKGYFRLATTQILHGQVSFAVINSNVPHRVFAPSGSFRVLMIEHRDRAIQPVLAQWGLELKANIYTHIGIAFTLADFQELSAQLQALEPDHHYDSRVQAVLAYLQQHEVPYESMLPTLTNLVHLSESRLSHLFKAQKGLSLKKYLLWCRLRSAISTHLDHQEGLFPALIKSGFYDQPHFSRAFKTMLGVKPSVAYNSRTVQL